MKPTFYFLSTLFISTFFTLGFSYSAHAGSASCQVVEQSFQSAVLSADTHTNFIEHYIAVLPKGYDPSLHYGTVYFLHGRGGERHLISGLGICDQLDRLIAQKKAPFIVIAPDGQDSYWMNGALTHQRWGDMVTGELVRDAESKYPLVRQASARVIAGISMGGHGAIQLSLNYPGIYNTIGAHSPVFRTQAESSQNFYYQFGTGADFQARDPFSLMMIKGKRLQAALYMDMGGSDVWLANTKNFADYLTRLNFPFINQVGTDAVGAHAMGYWQYHLGSYADWYSAHLPLPF